jgi:ribosome maturation factor RimP
MSWQETVTQTVTGLGFDLVDLERSAGGLLRVTIDLPWEPGGAEERFVTVEDCERVTRQLQYLLEVEAVDYKRLEVGSPGIDRPLRHENDFIRFTGQVIDIVLRAPIGVTGSAVAATRKKFRGSLERAEDGLRKKREPAPLQALAFELSELQQARLAPLVSFKGRSAGQVPVPRATE